MDRDQIATQVDIAGWLLIVRGEYNEMPGLNLTKPQAQRLWGLDLPTCDRVLSTLIHDHFLRLTTDGQYARADITH